MVYCQVLLGRHDLTDIGKRTALASQRENYSYESEIYTITETHIYTWM